MAQEPKASGARAERGQGAPAPSTDGTTAGAPQSVGKKIISDISGAQITASILAAVTSMLFSSQIGLAGSVIGVAASAGVTALSSSIYKSFIEGTKQKAIAQAQAGKSPFSGSQGNDAGSAGGQASSQDTEKFKRSVYSSDPNAFEADSGKYTHAAAREGGNGVSGSFGVMGKKWFIIILLTVIGLLTVFLTAHIINTATDGAGIGTKTTPIIHVVSSSSSSGSSSTVGTSSTTASSHTQESSSSATRSSSSHDTNPSASSAHAGKSSAATSSANADGYASSSSASNGGQSASSSASSSAQSQSSSSADDNTGSSASSDDGSAADGS